MNVVVLAGRLVKEIELKYTPEGKAVTNNTIAVQKSYKNAEGKYDAEFIDFVCWGKGAEVMADYIKKGDKFTLTGEWQTEFWEKDDGTKMKNAKVYVQRFDLPDQNRQQPQYTPGQNQQQPPQQQQYQQPPQQQYQQQQQYPPQQGYNNQQPY